MKRLLLINPPVMRPCEPPAGLFRLSLALSTAGVPHGVLDLNLEGLLWLMERGRGLDDGGRWSLRARKNLEGNLALIRSIKAVGSFDRYSRGVGEIDRLLADASPEGYTVSLANLRSDRLSPIKSADLIRAAERPEESPFYGHFRDRVLTAAGEGGHEIAGFSINYLGQALTAFAMMGLVRRAMPGMKIVAGGGLVSSWMASHDLSKIFGGVADSFVRGPGENALISMCTDNKDTDPVPVTSDGVFRCPDKTGYLAPSSILPFSASSGCHWGRCRFCPERAEGNRYVPVGTEAAVNELKALVSDHRPGLVHICDNAISPSLIRGLAANPPGAPWYGFARVSEELADEGFCLELKKSGCAMIKLGVESGSDAVLESMHKGFSTALASRVLHAVRRAGIPAYVYMLFGTPWEKEADARASLGFCVHHSDCIGFLNLALFNLPVHGPDTGGLATRPFYDADLGLYLDFDHPAGWDRRTARGFIEREFEKHPAIAPIIRRDPPVFTSSHAPFFPPAST